MVERLFVLVVLAAVGAGGLFVYQRYRGAGSTGPERLDIDALGLELMSGCCAFVVFTTPACRPCKAALRVVEGAAGRSNAPTEIRTVDAMEHSDLAIDYEVRTIPTVFLITASGHVVRRWKNVPHGPDVDEALALV
jgi:glutaredoxin